MKNYYIASCSCGKDSLAMVYRLIVENMPLDEIVFYDTGMEFNAIYKNWERLCFYVGSRGIKTTIIHSQIPFLCKMFEIEVKNRKGNGCHKGYSWCGGRCRWGTTEKLNALDKYCEERSAYCYIGIAADESHRLAKKIKSYKLHPLVAWEMEESDCLSYCRGLAIDWKENGIELYDILDRVSCWCCGNKNHWELWNYWKYLPEYWERLKELQSRTERPFKKPYSVFDMEERFEKGYVPNRRKHHE